MKQVVRPDFRGDGLTRGVEVLTDERSAMRGVNVGSDGRLFPRVALKDYSVMVASAEDTDDSVLELLLSQFCKPGSEAWRDYIAVRAGHREPMLDGRGEFFVQKTAVPRYVPPWERRKKIKETDKVKQYTLAQVIGDFYVRDKYGIPMKLITSIRSMALTSPADAAATAQEYIQSVSPTARIKVSAASYSDGVAGARRDIQSLAQMQPPLPAGQDALIIGSQIFVFCDKDGDNEWYVKGPLEYATTVLDIYRMALYGGKHSVIHLFAVETAKLKIDVVVQDEIVAPGVIGHAKEFGDDRDLVDSGTESLLVGELARRLEKLKRNVVSLDEGTVHYASATRLDSRVLVVNQHVMEEVEEPRVGGSGLTGAVVVADDLWAYRRDGEYEPWSYREPVMQERACIMYHCGTRVMLSAPFVIAHCDGEQLLSHLVDDVVPGMSGGAVIALSDLSLLGIHCGELRQYLVAVRLTSTVYQDIHEFVSISEDLRSGDLGSEDVVDVLLSRGLRSKLLQVVAALEPVYRGATHVGSAVRVPPGELVTTCSPGRAELSAAGQRSVEFGSVTATMLSRVKDGGGAVVDAMRSPVLNESVMLVGADGKGSPFVTGQLRVTFVGPFARNFFLSMPEGLKFEITGAVVVSLQDGHVLGSVVRVGETAGVDGSSLFCVALPDDFSEKPDLVDEVSRVFPRLTVTSWEASVLGEAFNAASDRFPGLVWLGKSYLQLRLARSLMLSNVPESLRDEYVKKLLAEENLSRLFVQLGLARLVVPAESGVVLTESNVKENAKHMAALVAVAGECEKDTQVDEWLASLGLVPKPGEFGGLDKVYGRLKRRSSGFAVLSEEGKLLVAVGDEDEDDRGGGSSSSAEIGVEKGAPVAGLLCEFGEIVYKENLRIGLGKLVDGTGLKAGVQKGCQYGRCWIFRGDETEMQVLVKVHGWRCENLGVGEFIVDVTGREKEKVYADIRCSSLEESGCPSHRIFFTG